MTSRQVATLTLLALAGVMLLGVPVAAGLA